MLQTAGDSKITGGYGPMNDDLASESANERRTHEASHHIPDAQNAHVVSTRFLRSLGN
jgi:hypothetical protein